VDGYLVRRNGIVVATLLGTHYVDGGAHGSNEPIHTAFRLFDPGGNFSPETAVVLTTNTPCGWKSGRG